MEQFYPSDRWKNYKSYHSVSQAEQAYGQLVKSGWHRRFDWRIVAEVGVINLPVVKACSLVES
jgi:hypothetical protein